VPGTELIDGGIFGGVVRLEGRSGTNCEAS
jgi:hypothetical protein